MQDPDSDTSFPVSRRIGLVAGALVFLVMVLVPAPAGLGDAAWKTAAVAALMAVWWMTEAIPIPATAMLPLVLFPGLGVLDMSGAAAPYANELIFLFMGGFFIAMAMERWGLHRRIALKILAAVGSSPRRVVLGFMLATAFLSMWISNTATATMMLPIALAVGEMFRPEGSKDYPFGTSLMLAIAYGASIGGVTTLIGTPPNGVLAASASQILGFEIGFVQWMVLAMPIGVVMLPAVWLLLVQVMYPAGDEVEDAGEVLDREMARLGPISAGERIVGSVFVLAAVSWVMRSPKVLGGFEVPGIQTFVPAVRDSTIAMAAALLLFVLPVSWKRGTFALDWVTARRIPWGVLILFGGGLSLAQAMAESGLAEWIGNSVEGLRGVPLPVLILAVTAMFVFLTEITSNAATATMAMPVMAGAAVGLGVDPLTLMITAAAAASMAFMLPAATPPNAIVFGSGYITIPQMARAGIVANLMAILVITVAMQVLLPLVF